MIRETERGRFCRVGITIDIQGRRGQYERKGYTGTMYYIQVANMKTAETTLLMACDRCSTECDKCCPDNIQRKSNVPDDRDGEGYVYGIAKEHEA